MINVLVMPKLLDVITVNDSCEVNPYYFDPGTQLLWFGENYGGNPNRVGMVKKLDTVSKSVTTVGSFSGWANWQAVVDIINKTVYSVGETRDHNGVMRACVTIIDTSKSTAETVLHPNTGDCNELIGVAIDIKNRRLIAGERIRGGGTTGSSWPNGGGLWEIPLETVNDPSTWKRVYQDPDGAEWRRIAIYGEYVYAAQSLEGGHRIIRASLSDLTRWTTLESVNRFVIPALDTWGRYIAYIVLPSASKAVLKYSTDGSTWNEIDITPGVSVDVARMQLYGKYAIIVLASSSQRLGELYVVDLEKKTVSKISELSPCGAMNKSMTPAPNGVYIGLGAAGGSPPAYIRYLAFDRTLVMTLSVSPQNPTPGSTVTLTAKIVDSETNEPVTGMTVEFYLVKGLGQMNSHDGEYIGEAETDTNGEATVKYTLPSNISGTIWFRAITR